MKSVRQKLIIGWREWIELPQLTETLIKAKVDTGARTSTLHATPLGEFERDGVRMIRFEFHPLQASTEYRVEGEAVLIDYRKVRSSSGHRQERPVIETTARLMNIEWPIEMTLTSRDEMGFRMLLGRTAIRKRFLVDAAKSYLGKKMMEGKGSPA